MSGLGNTISKYDELRLEVYDKYDEAETSSVSESLSYFSRCFLYSSKLIFKEKEIIFFALLQLVCIGLAYWSCVQMLHLMHDIGPAYNGPRGYQGHGYVLLIWIIFVFILTGGLLGLLTACMGAAHFLHESGQESTIIKCLRIVLPKVWSIFKLYLIDACWAIGRVKTHMPLSIFYPKTLTYTRLSGNFVADRWMREAIYQAWKISLLGVLPALIVGRGTAEACKDSLGILKTHFKTLQQLKIAYSSLRWRIGLGALVIGMFFGPNIFPHLAEENYVLSVMLPMIFALFFIQVFLKPIYILSICRIYSHYVQENNIKIILPKVPAFVSAFITLLFLAFIIWMAFLYQDTLEIEPIFSWLKSL